MAENEHKFATEIFIRARSAWLWLLVAMTWPAAVSAQQDMKACTLLTPAELSTAIGGSVGHATGIFTPKNSRLGRNGDFWSCDQMVGTRKVWIFFNTLPVTEEGKKRQQELLDRLRSKGYQTQIKEVGGLQCSTVVGPAGSKDASAVVGTSCGREKAPYNVLVKVGASGSNDLVSMEKVAALTEKAAARVPPQ